VDAAGGDNPGHTHRAHPDTGTVTLVGSRANAPQHALREPPPGDTIARQRANSCASSPD